MSDVGQALLKTAADAVSQDNYGFRVEQNDPPTSYGGPTTYFWRGLAMSFKTNPGGANTVIKAISSIEVNSTIVHVDPAELYDRFNTGESLSPWNLFHGNGTVAASPVVSANTLVSITGTSAGASYSATGSQATLVAPLNLATDTIVMEARVKLSAITDVAMFIGLTDQTAALEAPIESAASGNVLTANADNAVGFMFDTAMSTDVFWLVGVDATALAVSQSTGIAPVADTYTTLRTEVTTAGVATFYKDGAQIGTTMAAASAATNLYPTLAAASRAAASRTLTTDYAYARSGL